MDYLHDRPTPQVVKALVSRLGGMSTEQRARIVEDLKLSYYFGEQEIAFQRTPEGVLILAFGDAAQVAAVIDALPSSDKERFSVRRPSRFVDLFEALRTDPKVGELSLV